MWHVCGGGAAQSLAAIVAATRVLWEKIWRIAGHDPKQQAIPKAKHSWHCQHIEEEEKEPLCLIRQGP
jgi:hypothetical protein